ncbi:hypothetical protein GRI38_04315 [Altererythrobacter aurantiacus]|uniref:Uncharacterized protein n=1 Tax=Parapontixanthobacter aurantiacus TaxID=1463599 RepID=A0A844ZE09_9SPHN|nr:hypothetical protein [Parapontixanthobacter aurantiacus]MXO85247.1 hypothetical protein [Parapontixanthobacter aurantiacus]
MSRHLHRRVTVLEAGLGSHLWNLTDEQLEARMVEVCEAIERHPDRLPGMQPDNWRDLIAARNWKALEGTSCAI